MDLQNYHMMDETPAKHAKGRPRIETETLKEQIFSRLVNGESLRQICQDEAMPCRETVYSWLREDSAFLDQYITARALQADFIMDEILTIADNVEPDRIAIQKAQLQIKAREIALARMTRKEYGVNAKEATIQAKELTDDELKAELNKLGYIIK